MIHTTFIILLVVFFVLIILGHFAIRTRNGAPAAQIAAYILLLIIGLIVLIDGISFPTGTSTEAYDHTTNTTTVTVQYSNTGTIDTVIGSSFILLSILLFFVGIERAGETQEHPY